MSWFLFSTLHGSLQKPNFCQTHSQNFDIKMFKSCMWWKHALKFCYCCCMIISSSVCLGSVCVEASMWWCYTVNTSCNTCQYDRKGHTTVILVICFDIKQANKSSTFLKLKMYFYKWIHLLIFSGKVFD